LSDQNFIRIYPHRILILEKRPGHCIPKE